MQYVKTIGDNYGNYPYRLGLNTLKHNSEEFDPSEKCGPGGLYYTDIENVFSYVYGDTLCIITIPENAKVVKFVDKYNRINCKFIQ